MRHDSSGRDYTKGWRTTIDDDILKTVNDSPMTAKGIWASLPTKYRAYTTPRTISNHLIAMTAQGMIENVGVDENRNVLYRKAVA